MTAYPIITHGDDEAAVIARLVAFWATVAEDFTPAETTITVKIPATLDGTTAIQVDHEGVPDLTTFPFREQSQTRVVCWAPKGKRDWVKAMADLSIAGLRSTPSDSPGVGQEVGSITVLGGRSGVVPDPDTTNLSVWFLVKTSLRGKQQ